ncbi:MAG: AAA family ATPase [Gammaproteobacteria bacterium]|nr:AAA family ATPase [Gammaproteobacteria bacterium]
MDNRHDLNVILSSRVPLVVVETLDEARFLNMLSDLMHGAFGGTQRPLFRWSVTEGLRRIDRDMAAQSHNAEPGKVLKHIHSVTAPGIYVLLDFHPYLADPVNVRLLKDIAVESPDGARTVVLVSHELKMPAELERLSARFEMSLPDDNERAMIVNQAIKSWNTKNKDAAEIDPQAQALLITNLSGLTRSDAERLAHGAVFADGAITASDLPEVMQAKYELLNRKGALSFEYETTQFADVGGLNSLKRWLQQRSAAFLGDIKGLEPPKGMILIGVQGCGKSLAAKAAAGIMEVPLLRLDFGTLYNKYHGETEKNLRESLRQAELMSPCVLWIDEIEKGLAPDSGDNGLSRRILGTFLTWMSEKSASVFVVATANDISALPPELIRKGRFDEIFFVDLPDVRTRASIFYIHLKRRNYEPKQFDLTALTQSSDGFSGAEIEQAIVAALYTANANQQSLATDHIAEELQRTRPLSVVMHEKIAALRDWASTRTVAAD